MRQRRRPKSATVTLLAGLREGNSGMPTQVATPDRGTDEELDAGVGGIHDQLQAAAEPDTAEPVAAEEPSEDLAEVVPAPISRDPMEASKQLVSDRIGEDVDFEVVAAAWIEGLEAFKERLAGEIRGKNDEARKLAIERCVTQHVDAIFRTVFGVTLQALLDGTASKEGYLERAMNFLRTGIGRRHKVLTSEEIEEKRSKVIEILTGALQEAKNDGHDHLKDATMGMAGHCTALGKKLPQTDRAWSELTAKFKKVVFGSAQYRSALGDARHELGADAKLEDEIKRRCVLMLRGKLLVELHNPEVTKAALASFRYQLEEDRFMQLYPEGLA